MQNLFVRFCQIIGELQSCRVAELQSYRVTELQSYRVTELQSYRVTELQSYRVRNYSPSSAAAERGGGACVSSNIYTSRYFSIKT